MNLSVHSGGAVRARQIVAKWVAASCLVAISSGAVAVEYRIDRLTVERNGSMIFDDNFDDGLAPPIGTTFIGSTTPGYVSAIGNFAGEESNGKLTLDPTNRGVVTYNPFTHQPEGIKFQAAYLNVNTQSTPETASRGLKLHHTFTVSAVFDLVTPGPTTRFDGYGLRLDDFNNFGPEGWNDVLDLEVFRDGSTGRPRLELIERDFHGTNTRRGRTVLDPTLGDQIELTFTKGVVNDPTVWASYQYLSGGHRVGGPIMLASATLFNGEIFTRPGFIAVAQAVPEPTTWAMMVAGLLLTAGLSRRQAARTRNA
jgi:hypothetical protein